MNEQTRAIAGSALDEAEVSTATEEGRKLTIDQAVKLALDTLSR